MTELMEEGASALGGEKGGQVRCCWMLLDAVGLVTLYPSIPSCTRTVGSRYTPACSILKETSGCL